MFLETFMRLVPSTSSTSTTAKRHGSSSIVTLKLMRIWMGGFCVCVCVCARARARGE